MTDFYAEEAPAKPVWLMTLADLALLLVGFFVFLQATQMDRQAIADSLRAGFGATPDVAAMPVEMAIVDGFAPGGAESGDAAAALNWAGAATRDPRTRLNIIGETDGSAEDVDPLTGSAAILAADRARAVAAVLIEAGAIAPERIRISTATGQRRTVLTLGFEGDRK